MNGAKHVYQLHKYGHRCVGNQKKVEFLKIASNNPFPSNLTEIILEDPLQGLTVLFVWWTCIISRL